MEENKIQQDGAESVNMQSIPTSEQPQPHVAENPAPQPEPQPAKKKRKVLPAKG